jgi:hypothetical protein
MIEPARRRVKPARATGTTERTDEEVLALAK